MMDLHDGVSHKLNTSFWPRITPSRESMGSLGRSLCRQAKRGWIRSYDQVTINWCKACRTACGKQMSWRAMF